MGKFGDVMFITKVSLPRRSFLRGIGAAIALPLVDAMVPALSAMAATPAKPVRRLGFVYLPNGVAMNFKGVNYWKPTTEGANFQLSPILSPFAPFQKQMAVVSGTQHHQADVLTDGANGDHTRGTSTWLTGIHPKHTEGADVQNGVSADQVAAQQWGKETALPSLELALDINYLAGNCENGYACVYMNTLSWSSPTTPLPTENNPRVVFERLFGDGGTKAQRVAQIRAQSSILDSVNDELKRLLNTLGPGDRTTVADYVESVREVERRVQAAEKSGASDVLSSIERPMSVPERFDEHVGLLYDMQWLAFRADITRVTTFMLGRELNFRTYPEIGVTEGHHGLSHHGDRAEQLAKYSKVNVYQAQLFAKFLEKLRATPDGDGTLFDHALFLYGAGLSNPNLHAHTDLPLAVFGGAIKGGRHVAMPKETPMTNLLVGMLEKSGIPTEALGDSTGKVDI
jgi:uncharacterized protein DUF1552